MILLNGQQTQLPILAYLENQYWIIMIHRKPLSLQNLKQKFCQKIQNVVKQSFLATKSSRKFYKHKKSFNNNLLSGKNITLAIKSTFTTMSFKTFFMISFTSSCCLLRKKNIVTNQVGYMSCDNILLETLKKLIKLTNQYYNLVI